MNLIVMTLLAALAGSAISLIGGVLLLNRQVSARLVQIFAVPFAAGALIAASFLDLIPEIYAEKPDVTVSITIIVGFLLFFVLERFLGWFHHHHEHGLGGMHPTAGLVIIGDTVHNFIDGLVIGAAFLVDVQTGWIVTIAVAAHEIPQEVGDFGLLLALGMRRRMVLLVNVISALATVVAAMGVVLFLGDASQVEPYLLALAAGFFIYIAASDLIPTIHAETRLRVANIQTIILILGIIVVGVAVGVAGQ